MNFEELVFIKIGIANSVTKLLVTKNTPEWQKDSMLKVLSDAFCLAGLYPNLLIILIF